VIYKINSLSGMNLFGPFESEPSWSFLIELDDAKTTATFQAFDENGNERARKNLMVRQEHDSIMVYAKKKN
jgi:hypothetical protein